MNKEIKQCFILLDQYRYKLTKQQKRTFKGQIISGDYNGFRKGLFNLIRRKMTGEMK